MRSDSRLRVAVDASGTSRAVELRAEAPQLVCVTDRGGPDRPMVVHLLGGAAGPLGGDRSTFDLAVGAEAQLTVRSVAATLAHPGALADGQASHACVRADVGRGARLDWWPEPLIAVAGCDHDLHCGIDISAGGCARWVDELVSGRTGEPGGRLRVRQRVRLDARVVADHEVRVGPEFTGSGWHGRARVIVTAIEIGGPPPEPTPPLVTSALRAACFAPEPGVTLWIGLGDDLDAVRSALSDRGLTRDGPRTGSPHAGNVRATASS